MRLKALVSLIGLMLLIGASGWGAEQVTEVWRGTFDTPRSVSVDVTDGSVWAATGSSVTHLAADGVTLSRTSGFSLPRSVSANPADGSCWVADDTQVVHLAADGTEVWRGGGFDQPSSVSANPADGSCWVADTFNHQIVHLARDGTELWRGGGFNYPQAVSANPADGSCWVADYFNHQVVHLAAGGTELWRGGQLDAPRSVSANSADGSCWVADHTQVIHLTANGTEMWRDAGFDNPLSVSVNTADGSCWMADVINSQVVHLAGDGTELWRGRELYQPCSVSADPGDGSCWLADTGSSLVVHLAIRVDFVDVPYGYWACDQIAACASAGIVGGYGDGTYRPTLPVTRDQMAVFISRALAGRDSLVPSGPATATFSDVATDFWAFRYVEYAVDHGVVGGYADGTYRPLITVTRDQMAVFVVRALVGGESGVPTGPATASFPDVPTDFWAFKHVEYAKANGVVGGYPDGLYHPEIGVTRDQMAVFVARAFELPM